MYKDLSQVNDYLSKKSKSHGVTLLYSKILSASSIFMLIGGRLLLKAD